MTSEGNAVIYTRVMDSSEMLAKPRICVITIRNHLKVTTEGTFCLMNKVIIFNIPV